MTSIKNQIRAFESIKILHQHCIDVIAEEIQSLERHLKNVVICPVCKKGELMSMSTTIYDPEDIRHDMRCIECGMTFGTTKAGYVKFPDYQKVKDANER